MPASFDEKKMSQKQRDVPHFWNCCHHFHRLGLHFGRNGPHPGKSGLHFERHCLPSLKSSLCFVNCVAFTGKIDSPLGKTDVCHWLNGVLCGKSGDYCGESCGECEMIDHGNGDCLFGMIYLEK